MAETVLTAAAPSSNDPSSPIHQPVACRASRSPSPSNAPESVQAAVNASGHPLDGHTRTHMEDRFGFDFSRVRIHTDRRAADSAHEINALAYTVGSNIVFGAGQYAPHSPTGQRLLAHELTHVVQQTGNPLNSALGKVSASPRAAGLIQRQTIDTATCDTDQASRYREAHGEAITWVEYILTRLGNPQSVRSLLQRHFRLQPTDSGVETVRATYRQILSALRGNTNTYHCQPDATCRIQIGRDTNNNPIWRGGHASAHDITFCAYMFGTSDHNFVRLLVHETSHTNPANLPDGPYRGQTGYPGTSPLTNAEAYSEFAEDLYRFRLGVLLGLSGGFAAPLRGLATWQARLYYGFEFQHPVLGVFNPTLGLGFSFIGETTQPGSPPVASGPSMLMSLVAGVRIAQPSDDGSGGYVSIFGGPAFAASLSPSGGIGVGAEAGFGVGYRWRLLDLSAGIGYTYDPTREAGMEHLVTGSVTATIPIDRLLE